MNNDKKIFIDQIIKNLESNGFPQNKVTLPTDRMFEISDKKGFSFNEIINELENLNIISKIGPDKILFIHKNDTDNSINNFDPPNFQDMDQEELMKKANDFMKTMTPEQMDEIKRMYENMSNEEKEEIIKRGKEMGLI